MPALSRMVSIRGPRFWHDDEGQLLFVNHLDGSTRDGPRPATAADKKAHPEAYAESKTSTAEPPGGVRLRSVTPR